jgi:hypothetical protein
MMRRCAAVFLVALGCGGCSKPAAPSPASAPAKARSVGIVPASTPTCRDVWGADDRRIRLVSQGSHAAARTDVSIDVASRKATGSTFELEGDTPVPVVVERTLPAADLDPLIEYLGALCVPVQVAGHTGDDTTTGTTYFEITDASDTTRKLSHAISGVTAGETHQSLERDQWDQVIRRWPELAP